MRNWSIVCTADAPAWLINLHANYHLERGSAEVIYFLDKPQRYSQADLQLIGSAAKYVLCTDSYWAPVKGRPERNHHRQAINLQSARHLTQNDWILHIDIDEFLHFPSEELFQGVALPSDFTEIRIPNVERVLEDPPRAWSAGYLRGPVADIKLLEASYGPCSVFFGMGLANYFHGKSLVANRPHIKQNVHGAVHRDPSWEVVRYQALPSEALIIHMPCFTERHFVQRYTSYFVKGHKPSSELQHQLKFRAFLHRRVQEIGLQTALAEGCRILHFCDSETAQQRLNSGLYKPMPKEFLERIARATKHQAFLDYAWANAALAQYYGL